MIALRRQQQASRAHHPTRHPAHLLVQPVGVLHARHRVGHALRAGAGRGAGASGQAGGRAGLGVERAPGGPARVQPYSAGAPVALRPLPPPTRCLVQPTALSHPPTRPPARLHGRGDLGFLGLEPKNPVKRRLPPTCMAAGMVMIFWMADPRRSLRARGGRDGRWVRQAAWLEGGAGRRGSAASARRVGLQASPCSGSFPAPQPPSPVVVPVHDLAHVRHLVWAHCGAVCGRRWRGRGEAGYQGRGCGGAGC